MRCADLAELISAYADAQTLPAQTEFVEAHLAACPRCRATLHRYRQSARLLRLVDQADEWAVPDLRLRLAHATAAMAAARSRRMSLLRGLSGGLIAALVVSSAIAGAGGAGRIRQVALGTPQAPMATACGVCTQRIRFGPPLTGQSPPVLAIAAVPAWPAQQAEAPPQPHPAGGAALRTAMRAVPL